MTLIEGRIVVCLRLRGRACRLNEVEQRGKMCKYLASIRLQQWAARRNLIVVLWIVDLNYVKLAQIL